MQSFTAASSAPGLPPRADRASWSPAPGGEADSAVPRLESDPHESVLSIRDLPRPPPLALPRRARWCLESTSQTPSEQTTTRPPIQYGTKRWVTAGRQETAAP